MKSMTEVEKLLFKFEITIESTGDIQQKKQKSIDLYNEIDKFSKEEQKQIAVKLKAYWEQTKEWEVKKTKKKQIQKVNKLKSIINSI